MFGWLRDTLATTSPTHSYRRSMIPSSLFRQQQETNKRISPRSPSSDDDDEGDDEGTEEDFNDNSFYHNPYQSTGLMNYVDVPQQQFTNENTYPTYLAQRQTSIDDQIYRKLVSLQQRGNSSHQPCHYQYENGSIPSAFLSNIEGEKCPRNEDHHHHHRESQLELTRNDDDDDGIRAYYPGQYPPLDEHFDFASVVLWYRNVMQSVKKIM